MQQCCRDRDPLRLKLVSCSGAARASVPVSRVGEIAFFPMQVGVNPRCARIGLIPLHAGMRPVPVAPSIPPERLQSQVESWRGLGPGERGSKLLKGT